MRVFKNLPTLNMFLKDLTRTLDQWKLVLNRTGFFRKLIRQAERKVSTIPRGCAEGWRAGWSGPGGAREARRRGGGGRGGEVKKLGQRKGGERVVKG